MPGKSSRRITSWTRDARRSTPLRREREKVSRREQPASSRDRSAVRGQPLFLPHKPGVIAYAGKAVARICIQRTFKAKILPELRYILFQESTVPDERQPVKRPGKVSTSRKKAIFTVRCLANRASAHQAQAGVRGQPEPRQRARPGSPA